MGRQIDYEFGCKIDETSGLDEKKSRLPRTQSGLRTRLTAAPPVGLPFESSLPGACAAPPLRGAEMDSRGGWPSSPQPDMAAPPTTMTLDPRITLINRR
jgi:hypothetical protein